VRRFSRELDYSEDGSLTADPRLLLSEDEDLLVLERGGYYVDAIHLPSETQLAEHVGWEDPERERRWQERHEQIVALLESHRAMASQRPHPHEREVLRVRCAEEVARSMCSVMAERVTALADERGEKIDCHVFVWSPPAQPAECVSAGSEIACEIPAAGGSGSSGRLQFRVPLRHDRPPGELAPPNERLPLDLDDHVYTLGSSLRLGDRTATEPVDWSVIGVFDDEGFLILGTMPPGSSRSWSTPHGGSKITQDPILAEALAQAFPYRTGDRLPLPPVAWADNCF
jgi:hypothetical protein